VVGQSVALIAPSGVGKSTLLHIAGPARTSDGGEVYIDGAATSSLSDAERTASPHRGRLRLSVSSTAAGVHRDRERDAAADDPRSLTSRSAQARDELWLSRPEGAARASAAQLSGGEQQRVAIAARLRTPRAFCWPTSRPAISIPRTAGHVFLALTATRPRSGLAAVIATHNMELAQRMDRRVTLEDGRVVEIK
jgi:lipoprotein-releasing system ATP-binding protein